MASRGRMMGKKTFHTKSSRIDDGCKGLTSMKEGGWDSCEYGVGINLVDPLFQDLDRRSRHYLSYCEQIPSCLRRGHDSIRG